MKRKKIKKPKKAVNLFTEEETLFYFRNSFKYAYIDSDDVVRIEMTDGNQFIVVQGQDTFITNAVQGGKRSHHHFYWVTEPSMYLDIKQRVETYEAAMLSITRTMALTLSMQNKE